jgi:hypothetical protein
MPLFYIQGKNIMPITNFLLKEEDKKVEKIKGYNYYK